MIVVFRGERAAGERIQGDASRWRCERSRRLAQAQALRPCVLNHTRDLPAARGCPPSQAPENGRSSPGRLSHTPGPDAAASPIDGYARFAQDRKHISRPTHASHIARAAHVHRSVRVRRVLHRIRSAAQTDKVAHARSRPTRVQLKDTAIWTATLAKLVLEVLLHAGFLSWRSGTQERCRAARGPSVPVGSVVDSTVG